MGEVVGMKGVQGWIWEWALRGPEHRIPEVIRSR